MAEKEKIGHFIERRRKMLGLTQRDLALSLGYTFQAISKLENEGFVLPLNVLPSLANTLKLSLQDILERNAEGLPPEEPYDPIDVSTFADNIIFLRGLMKYSQTQEANYVGASKRSIINYEQGLSIPNTKVFEKLVELYSVTPDDLLYKNMVIAAEKEAILARKKKLSPAWVRPLMNIASALFLAGGIAAITTPRVVNHYQSETVSVATATALKKAITENRIANIELTGDIDLTDAGWDEVIENKETFLGTLNGNGYTISGLDIDSSSQNPSLDGHSLGLFPSFRGIVKNLCLSDFSITLDGSGAAGALCGTFFGGSIENVEVIGADIKANKLDSASHTSVGGLIGRAYTEGSIDRCAIFGGVIANDGENPLGGLIGLAKFKGRKMSVSNCLLALEKVELGEVGGPCGEMEEDGETTSSDFFDQNSIYWWNESDPKAGQSGGIGYSTVTSDSLDDESFYLDRLSFSKDLWNLSDLKVSEKRYPTLINQVEPDLFLL